MCEKQVNECKDGLLYTNVGTNMCHNTIDRKLQTQDAVLDSVEAHLKHTKERCEQLVSKRANKDRQRSREAILKMHDMNK